MWPRPQKTNTDVQKYLLYVSVYNKVNASCTIQQDQEEQHYQSDIEMGTESPLLRPMMDTEEEQHYQPNKIETKPPLSRKNIDTKEIPQTKECSN